MASTTIFGGLAGASHDAAPCTDVTLVFARGSGQSLDQREAPRFFEKVTARLDGVGVNSYELGTETHNGAQYPAYGIGVDSLQSFKNLVEADASWTGVAGGEYNASVTAGVTELKSYLSARALRCPDEQFVVGGYSQGAQVVGNTLPGLSSSVRDRIAYVSLFGDPKLYLPEGNGLLPSACRGGDFSPWRRGNVSCWTDSGILEGRDPYVPSDLEDRTGSWCDREDPICNNNLGDFIKSSHGEYSNDGAEMDDAVVEIAESLRGRLPEHADTIDVVVIRFAAGADGLDVAFVIDTTGSMGGQIGSAVAVADSVGQQVVAVNGRVALTEYKDAFDPFVARIHTPLSQDLPAFKSSLSTLYASGGGDIPEALLTALMTTFNGLQWKPGATKAAVVLTDAGYHDPDVAQGWTLGDVVARSLEIDPVNVYPVVPSHRAAEFQALAEATAGQVIVNTGDTAAALRAAFNRITTRPVVFFELGEYVAAPGAEIVFRADAYDVDSTIVRYEWDLNGDGTTDATTTEPTLTHAYPSAFSGLAEVRAFSADGGVGSAVAPVTVDSAGLASRLPAAPGSLRATSSAAVDGLRTVDLTWQAPATGVPATSWVVRGGTGEVVALLPSTQTSLRVAGVPEETVTFSVRAANQYGEGGTATVTAGPLGSDPGTLLEALRADVAATAMSAGTRTSLLAKLDAAIAGQRTGNRPSLCGQLRAFRQELASSRVAREVTASDRDDWRHTATAVSDQSGC